jgi:antitoxin PrlF
MMETAKISSQGQVTIPKAIRDKLSVNNGDELAFIDYGTHIGIIRKTLDISDIKGIGAQYSNVKLTIEEMSDAVGNPNWEQKN